MATNQEGFNIERVRLLLLICFMLALTTLPAPGIAAQERIPDESAVDARTKVASSDSQKAELLLFWEEKELYVETATRNEKPLTKAPENMTVVTAREIEAMNAHSLADVLNRVPGLFVDSAGWDFNSSSQLHIQGSSVRLVTVLLDGVVWNTLAGNNASINSIPVRIVERIEIIKGPASAAWGSALGGVINIITKGTGDTAIPRGAASASYGEANSQEYNGELYGKGGPLGYYLFAGRQQTDGLRNDRNEEQNRFYAKLNLAPTSDLTLFFTTGYSDPFESSGNISGNGVSIISSVKTTAFFATGGAEYRISPKWGLKVGAQIFQQKADIPATFTAPPALAGQFFKGQVYDEQTVAGNVKLIYGGGRHTMVVGLDASHGDLDQTTTAGPLYQSMGLPARSLTRPGIDKWAVFANDTMEFGPLAVTPGVRLDYDSVSGYFVSPGIGATYEPGEHTVLRASVARGFTSPPLGYTSGGGIFMVPNPALKREDGWSYQVGVESGVMEYVNAKATLFRHDIHNAIGDTLTAAKTIINVGDLVRQGYELEVETVPLYNVSLKLSHSYAHIKPDGSKGKDDYSYLVGLKYDDRASWVALLTGAYVWMEQDSQYNAKYNSFIWDFNINKRFRINDTTGVDLFMTVHNLFSGAHYIPLTSTKTPSGGSRGGSGSGSEIIDDEDKHLNTPFPLHPPAHHHLCVPLPGSRRNYRRRYPAKAGYRDYLRDQENAMGINEYLFSRGC